MNKTETNIVRWLAGPNTGLSSEAMAYCYLGIQRAGRYSGTEHPLDPGDLNRCMLLVELVPEIKEKFDDIAKLSWQWAEIIGAWDELRDLLESEVGPPQDATGLAHKTYARMKELGL